MKSLLILLIATYLLSGFVSTQVGLPASSQVPIRVLIAGILGLPFLSVWRLKGLSPRSLAICFATAFGGYIIGAWAFSHAIALGGYAVAVFVTSLPWLGFVELAHQEARQTPSLLRRWILSCSSNFATRKNIQCILEDTSAVFSRHEARISTQPPLSRYGQDLPRFLKRGCITRSEVGVLGLSTIGAAVFFAPSLSLERGVDNIAAIITWSLVAALAGAFAQYARRFHRHEVSSFAVADGVLVSAVIQAFVFLGSVDLDLRVGSDAVWLFIGGGCYFISNRLSNVVFASVSPTLAAVWMSTEPIIALVISALFLGVRPTVCEFIGGGILLGAAVCKSWQARVNY